MVAILTNIITTPRTPVEEENPWLDLGGKKERKENTRLTSNTKINIIGIFTSFGAFSSESVITRFMVKLIGG